jgi:hypothetical protein
MFSAEIGFCKIDAWRTRCLALRGRPVASAPGRTHGLKSRRMGCVVGDFPFGDGNPGGPSGPLQHRRRAVRGRRQRVHGPELRRLVQVCRRLQRSPRRKAAAALVVRDGAVAVRLASVEVVAAVLLEPREPVLAGLRCRPAAASSGNGLRVDKGFPGGSS